MNVNGTIDDLLVCQGIFIGLIVEIVKNLFINTQTAGEHCVSHSQSLKFSLSWLVLR